MKTVLKMAYVIIKLSLRKGLPSRKMTNNDEVKKVEIINHLKLIRDAPTKEIYLERKGQLEETTTWQQKRVCTFYDILQQELG